jgi:hypothetical protein
MQNSSAKQNNKLIAKQNSNFNLEGKNMLNIWEKQKGETRKQYEKFLVYRDLGPRRTLLEAYQIYEDKPAATTPTGTWYVLSEKQDWNSRAKLWDLEQYAERELEDVGECRQYNFFRRKLVSTFLPKVFRALDAVDPESVKWSDLNTSLKMIMTTLNQDAQWAKETELAHAMLKGENQAEKSRRDNFAKKQAFTSEQTDC